MREKEDDAIDDATAKKLMCDYFEWVSSLFETFYCDSLFVHN